MEATFCFRRWVPGGGRWGRVWVVVGPPGSSGVVISDQAGAWQRQVYGENAGTLVPAEFVQEAREGVLVALAHAGREQHVVVTGIEGLLDTCPGDVVAATAGAVWQALGWVPDRDRVPFVRGRLVHVPLTDGTVRVYPRHFRSDGSGRIREEHLRRDLLPLAECFPDGVGDEEYLILVAALNEEYSDRNLAALMEAFTGRDYHEVSQDIALVTSTLMTQAPSAAALLARLHTAGWVSDVG